MGGRACPRPQLPDVLERFAGKTDHVVELERKPAVLKDHADSLFNNGVVQRFVDDRLHAGGSFGRA